MPQRIAILTGAGVSAESGLGTYRDNGGLWDQYDPMEVASAEGWRRNPGLVLEFYNQQREKLKDCVPNGAHKAIAALEKDFIADVITQNVDDLHERAGSSRVLHLHGEVTKVRPQDSCTWEDDYSEKQVMDIGYGKVSLGDLSPKGVQLRPHIVFFGEQVPKIEEAARIVAQADILLIVGTSMQVYPAASLYTFARPDCPVYLIDPADVAVRDRRIVHIREKATDGMLSFRKNYLPLHPQKKKGVI
ncbi:MAG: NAD-dependent deacylase [Bacteroidales bacterium]|nr:NAD-dependent deacylase [Bacteroidales bacterium]